MASEAHLQFESEQLVPFYEWSKTRNPYAPSFFVAHGPDKENLICAFGMQETITFSLFTREVDMESGEPDIAIGRHSVLIYALAEDHDGFNLLIHFVKANPFGRGTEKYWVWYEPDVN